MQHVILQSSDKTIQAILKPIYCRGQNWALPNGQYKMRITSCKEGIPCKNITDSVEGT